MIVDLNLQNKKIVIVGGGNEAVKRINSLRKQKCEIIVISDSVNLQINKLAKVENIKIVKQKIENAEFISEWNPDLIMTTTNDKNTNQIIINAAKQKNVITYSSDNPEDSDFSNPAIIDFENTVQIAIFTGGKSPAMSKKIKEKAERTLKEVITKEDIIRIKIQKTMRELAKKTISTQEQRKKCLLSIMTNTEIDQLIKDGQMKKAEKQAITLLRNWK